ncbi:MAG: PP2C family protein-serine/threonine phosphatase [Spirochaetes bacterium]|nr:PP2C family protein-serine/threonine phosphatase [Spirochaetota bacterium]
MSRPISIIVRLSLKMETYAFLMVTPLIVYFVVISGAHRGPDVMIIVVGAVLAVPFVLMFGIPLRIIRLFPLLNSLYGPGSESLSEEKLMRIKRGLLAYPLYEGIVIIFRWLLGLTIAAFYVYRVTGIFGDIEYLLSIILVVPLSYTLFYFTTENFLARVLMDDRLSTVMLQPGTFRHASLFIKMLLILCSIIIIPTVVFGYLFVLSQAGLIHFQYIRLHITFIVVLSILSIVSTAYESTITIRRGMRLTVRTLEKMRGGNFDTHLAMISRDEISVITQYVNFLAEALRSYVRRNRDLTENLERKVEERTEELNAALEELTAMNDQLKEARDELWGEMELTKKIQTSLLPAHPVIRDYEVAVHIAPAAQVGGDYYDVINCPGVDWVVIGDVSGHGVPAGLVMMMAQTAIRTLLRNDPNVEPHRLIAAMNGVLHENMKKFAEDKYMTLTVIAVHGDGTLRFSGLHEDMLIYHGATGTVTSHETDGVWIGMYGDIGGQVSTETLVLEPGDALLLHTDGVVQAWNRESVLGQRTPEIDMFGQDRLAGLLERNGGKSPDAILGEIVRALEEFRRDDDATVVIVKRVSP